MQNMTFHHNIIISHMKYYVVDRPPPSVGLSILPLRTNSMAYKWTLNRIMQSSDFFKKTYYKGKGNRVG